MLIIGAAIQSCPALMKLFSFKSLRILILMIILVAVAIYTQQQSLVSRGWYQPLQVTIYPINADGAAAVADYIARLHTKDFAAVDEFMARESQRYGIVASTPTITKLAATVDTVPPAPPASDANVINIMWWSLRLRWWAWWNTPNEDAGGVRMYVLYHAPEENRKLAHSLGLQKGLLGVVHAFATPEQNHQNNIIIAHELLHTVGAADKYQAGGEPLFPQGYAQPDRVPLYPQARAEIMAVRIPLSEHASKMAESLRSTVVGEQTAREINWIEVR
jgi:hypothetical protein